MASRRNADFLVFDSTIVRVSFGLTSLIGMAGEPPPEPTSRNLSPPSGITLVAINGSMINLVSDESVSTREVRLILVFQRAKSVK